MKVVLAIAAASLVAPVTAAAAVVTEFDRSGGIRVTLAGRALTAEIVHTPRYDRSPTVEELLYDQRVLGACGTSFRPTRRGLVFRRSFWPVGVRRLSFGFARDISRRVKWCLLEGHSGWDVSFVSFVDAEPHRLVARGRAPSGGWWRLSGWRGERLEPCLGLRTAADRQGSSSRCFDGLAEREATLAVDLFEDDLDRYIVGAVARSATAVRVRLVDGAVVHAQIYSRAQSSRVRAAFFVLPLPRDAAVRGARAVAADGRTVGRKRLDYD